MGSYSRAVAGAHYHLGFGAYDLAGRHDHRPPQRGPGPLRAIATQHLADGGLLARNRGLDASSATLPGGPPVVCATSGMGAP